MEIFLYPIILVIYAIWQIFPSVGFWIYLIFIVFYLFFALAPTLTAGKTFEPIKTELLTKLSRDEYDFLRRHAVYYMYPFGARSFSAIASFLQLLGIIFGIVFLIRHYWFYGIISILNYPIFAFIAPMLNKPFFLSEAMRSGNMNPIIMKEAMLAQRVGEFMQNEWSSFIKELKIAREAKDASYKD